LQPDLDPTSTPHTNTPLAFTLPFSDSAPTRSLASFPTRRSSDLIVYRGGLGPFHYKPAEVRQWLAAKYGAVKQGAQTAAASASRDPKSTRLNSSHVAISYAVFRLEKKKRRFAERFSRDDDAYGSC